MAEELVSEIYDPTGYLLGYDTLRRKVRYVLKPFTCYGPVVSVPGQPDPMFVQMESRVDVVDGVIHYYRMSRRIMPRVSPNGDDRYLESRFTSDDSGDRHEILEVVGRPSVASRRPPEIAQNA